ncbi:double zinc ribbon domain-containing protein [Verrucomicrobiota bacterium]
MQVLTTLLDLVYPRWCAGCGRTMFDHPLHICWECLSSFTRVEAPYCSKCGDPVDGMVEHDFVCGACRALPPAFDRARSALRYRGSLRNALGAFKYGRTPCICRDFEPFLSGCLDVHYASAGFDAVTFVPLYHAKERERTFNQARLLAHRVASRRGLPLLCDCLRRTRKTETQTGLRAVQRTENVRGAFRSRNDAWLEGRRLLLVDDVMTTGATVDACSRALKSAGAALVCVLTLARG